MSFVRAANPIWYLPDLTGEPLNDEYYAFFLTNTLPYLPQNVYRDPQGQTVWTGDVIQFYPNGTLPNNLYFDPNLVYRIEVRHGNSQSDALIYEVNDFVPDEGQSIITETALLTSANQIANPTFSQVFFTAPPGQSEPVMSITTAGTYDVAPGWELVLTGTGSTTLTQVIWSADQNVSGNPVPAYALRIANSGWTTATLRQVFNHNGGIWANGAVAMSLDAMGNGSSQLLSMNYSPESPGTPIPVINNVTVPNGVYETFSAAANIGQSTNTNLNDISFVNIDIVLPASGSVDISNVQVVGQSTPLDNPVTAPLPSFQQQTEERITDQLFHVYADQLLRKPKKNLLTGWNFSLNPFQFNPIAVTAQTSQTVYIADQTILYQETNNNLSTGKCTIDQREGLQVSPTATSTNTRFAIIQYIDPATILPYWSYIVSSLVRARLFTTVGTTVGLKMRLIWRTTLPSTIGATEPIASWPLGGDPVFAAGWTAIAPENDPEYTLLNSYADNENTYPAYPFEDMQLPNASATTMTLGIVVYTTDRMAVNMGDLVVFDKISLLQNLFASDADPETFDESMRKCQYYFESSYNNGVVPGTASSPDGAFVALQEGAADGSGTYLFGAAINLPYKTYKRADPSSVHIYSPISGTNNRVSGNVVGGGSILTTADVIFTNAWALVNAASAGQQGASYFCNSTAKLVTSATPNSLNPNGFVSFHYTIDSRLGV